MSVMMPIYRRAPGDGGDPPPVPQPGQQPTQTAQPGGQGGTPLQPAYAGVPQGQVTYANDPYATDPRFAVSQILQGFAPQAARATGSLNDTLASMGVSGGGAVDAQTGLQSQLAAALAPSLGQAYTQYAGNSLAQTLQNASAANAMTGMNVNNTLQGNEFNAGSYNSMQALLAQLLEEEYQTQAGAQTGITEAGLSGQTGINQGFLGNSGGLAQQQQQNFPVYQPPNFSGLGAALGAYKPPAVPAPTPPPYVPTSFNG